MNEVMHAQTQRTLQEPMKSLESAGLQMYKTYFSSILFL